MYVCGGFVCVGVTLVVETYLFSNSDKKEKKGVTLIFGQWIVPFKRTSKLEKVVCIHEWCEEY